MNKEVLDVSLLQIEAVDMWHLLWYNVETEERVSTFDSMCTGRTYLWYLK